MAAADTTENAKPPGVRRLGFVPAFDGVRGRRGAPRDCVPLPAPARPVDDALRAPCDFTRLPGGAVHKVTHLVLVLRVHPKPFFGSLFPKGGFARRRHLLRAERISHHGAAPARARRARDRISFPGFYRRRALRLLPALVPVPRRAADVLDRHARDVGDRARRDRLDRLLLLELEALLHVPGGPEGARASLVVVGRGAVLHGVAVGRGGVRRRPATSVDRDHGDGRVHRGRSRCGAYVLAEHGNLLLLYFRTDVRADALLVGALTAYLWTRGMVPPRRFLVPAGVVRARVRHGLRRSDSRARPISCSTAVSPCSPSRSPSCCSRSSTPTGSRRAFLTNEAAPGRRSGLVRPLPVALLRVHDRGRRRWATYSHGARIATAFGITIAATLFSWFVVEQRFLRRKQRVLQRRRR